MVRELERVIGINEDSPKWGTGGLVQLPGDFSRLVCRAGSTGRAPLTAFGEASWKQRRAARLPNGRQPGKRASASQGLRAQSAEPRILERPRADFRRGCSLGCEEPAKVCVWLVLCPSCGRSGSPRLSRADVSPSSEFLTSIFSRGQHVRHFGPLVSRALVPA